MAKLFVKADLREYMWNHLSAVLVGMPSLNQTFHNYIGVGQNGKSVLTDLMSQTLGSYKVAAPISIITQGRGKIGGLAPEIVALKGARYVVMQEPESTDVVHEGPMKELVSGVEPITARAPYMIASVTFVPQFSLVVCCNQFMAVRTQDHGTWRRFRVTPFESLFTEKPVDNDPDKPYQFKLDCELKDKFPVWRETFLAMLVDRAYVNQGKVTDCDIVMSASNAYRERQDYLAEFTRDKVTRCPGSTIRKSQLSEEFRMWYSTNFGTKNPSPKNLHDYMDRQYGKNISGVWSNVKLKFHDDDNHDFQGVNEEDLGDEIVLNEI
jgi:putative DNA primase/helicase